MQVSVWRHRVGAIGVLAAVVAVISMVVTAPSSAARSASPLTNSAAIQKLAAKAYEWGLAPEFVYLASPESGYVTGQVLAVTGGVPFV